MAISICGRSNVIVSSFAEGGKIRRITTTKTRERNDDVVLAEALCIMHEEGEEVAEQFLDRWARANHPVTQN
jgi:hypothetical protein